MSLDLHTQQIIRWHVCKVMPMRNKYGFRARLTLKDGQCLMVVKCNFPSKETAELARKEFIKELYAKEHDYQE